MTGPVDADDAAVQRRAQGEWFRLGLVWTGRLGPGDQLHVLAQLLGAEIHDVVALLAQRPGTRPVAIGGDLQQRDPHAQVLHVRDHLREVFLGAHYHHVADGLVPRQRGEVAVNLAFHAFPAPWAHLRQPKLHPGQVGQHVVVGGSPAFNGRLVPVATQQREPGALHRQVAEQLQQSRVVPGD